MNLLQSINHFFSRFSYSQEEAMKRLVEQDRFLESEEGQKKIHEDIIKAAVQKNKKESADEKKAERLARALDYVVGLPYYKKRGKTTYCNILARKFLLGNFDYGFYDNNKDPHYYWLNYDILKVFNYIDNIKKSTRPIYEALYNCSVENAFKAAVKAVNDKKNGVTGLTPKEAQEQANTGIPVWGVFRKRVGKVETRHEVIVYPNRAEKYYDDKGPKVAQAGTFNVSDIYASDWRCWGSDPDKWYTWPNIKGEVLFIQFPERPPDKNMPFFAEGFIFGSSNVESKIE